MDDFNRLRMISKRLLRAPFRRQWDFKVEIEGLDGKNILPLTLLNTRREDSTTTLDLLIKGISYSPAGIDTEQVKAGALTLTYPTGLQPTEVTLTARDLTDGRWRRWLESRIAMVANGDGTVNLPHQYLFVMRIASLTDPANSERWRVYPTKVGELSGEVDGEGFTEFPATFIQFSTGG